MPSSFWPWFLRKDNTDPPAPSKRSPSTNTLTVIPETTGSSSPWTRLKTHCNKTPTTAFFAFMFGAASGAGAILAWRRWGMRLRTAAWVTPNEFARRRWVRGVVTSVGDADDFRLFHTPGFGWQWPLKIRRVPVRRKDLKDQTIHIRIAGVDAPEGAHYGRPGQAHAEESLAWLRKRIQGKIVYCQFIRKDQYGRVVGVPLIPRPFLPLILCKYFGSPLALEMLRAGMATTYENSGAEYGPWGREVFQRVEDEARAARRGMWRNGANIEMPGEYKRRYTVALGTPANNEEELGGGKDDDKEGHKNRLLSRLSALLTRK
ncbi:SNase-domain-containing protein [Chiua virens]|nr:SNase-domain-containing protein [Chiua virens]